MKPRLASKSFEAKAFGVYRVIVSKPGISRPKLIKDFRAFPKGHRRYIGPDTLDKLLKYLIRRGMILALKDKIHYYFPYTLDHDILGFVQHNLKQFVTTLDPWFAHIERKFRGASTKVRQMKILSDYIRRLQEQLMVIEIAIILSPKQVKLYNKYGASIREQIKKVIELPKSDFPEENKVYLRLVCRVLNIWPPFELSEAWQKEFKKFKEIQNEELLLQLRRHD